jgi:hypothetical protein
MPQIPVPGCIGKSMEQAGRHPTSDASSAKFIIGNLFAGVPTS